MVCWSVQKCQVCFNLTDDEANEAATVGSTAANDGVHEVNKD